MNNLAMVVQAAAAGEAFESNPARARTTLAAIESTGRQALAELRRLLGVVRAGDKRDPRAPQPTLARVRVLLVERLHAAGLPVQRRIEGGPFAVPTGVDLSAGRIVQEALPNALKHAHASTASVVGDGDGEFALEVCDDGIGPSGGGAERPGRRLIGMRQRAALLEGELEAGPAPGGGLAAAARFPVCQGKP
jgi:signal transduction histidine kinase